MITYYELLENGLIGNSTTDPQYAQELDLTLTTEEEIITVSDGLNGDKRYLRSEFEALQKTAEYQERQLNNAKLEKLAENERARKVEFITTSLGRLKTETPLGDLKVALPLYEKLAEANNGLPANSVRVYDTQGNVQGSPAMTLTKFKAITLEIAMAYIAIDAKSTAITKAIQDTKTLEELEAIEVKYD